MADSFEVLEPLDGQLHVQPLDLQRLVVLPSPNELWNQDDVAASRVVERRRKVLVVKRHLGIIVIILVRRQTSIVFASRTTTLNFVDVFPQRKTFLSSASMSISVFKIKSSKIVDETIGSFCAHISFFRCSLVLRIPGFVDCQKCCRIWHHSELTFLQARRALGVKVKTIFSRMWKYPWLNNSDMMSVSYSSTVTCKLAILNVQDKKAPRYLKPK